MTVRFYELAIGAAFVFRGKSFVKEAMCMAHDEQRLGTIFMGETVVESDGPLLPPEVAAQWKPYRGHWTAMIEGLCSQPPATPSPSDERSQPGAARDRG
jgi:hypothetical protein